MTITDSTIEHVADIGLEAIADTAKNKEEIADARKNLQILSKDRKNITLTAQSKRKLTFKAFPNIFVAI